MFPRPSKRLQDPKGIRLVHFEQIETSAGNVPSDSNIVPVGGFSLRRLVDAHGVPQTYISFCQGELRR